MQIARLGDAALDADNAAEYDAAWGKKQRQIDLDANAQAARFAAARRDALDNGYDQVWGISADRQESIAEPTGLTKAAGFVAFSGGLAITGKNAAAFNQNLGNLISAFQGETDPDAYEPNGFADKVAKDAGWSNDAVVLAGVADAAADLVSGNFINGYSFGAKTIRLPGNPHIPALLQKERMLSFDMKIGRQASIDAPKIWGYSEKIGEATSAAGVGGSFYDVYKNKFGGD